MSAVDHAESGVEGTVTRYRYRHAAIGGYDELLGHPGEPTLEQTRLAEAIEAIGPGGLVAAREEARRLVADDGIQYGVAGEDLARSSLRAWHIDPLPLVMSSSEWSAIERGVQQRSQLLNLLMEDFYGERLLLRRGLIPAEVVLGHPGFVRQADGLTRAQSHLRLGSHDLGRDATGAWRVLADRTSAPSGAGYAMANRRIVSRVVPELHRSTDLARLRGFFHTMRSSVIEAAPGRAESPRAVLLSPGPHSETAYDQAFLASLLGFPLVESDDLALRDGQVWLRSGTRLSRVDAVLRRVDPEFCDPLEFRSDSQLGLPGLLEAVRRGAVSVLNPLGARVLENPGLAPYLPAVARELLGEDLLLQSAPTWWCGDPASRKYVGANLHRLIVRRIDSTDGISAHHGWLQSAAALAEVRAAVEAEPWAWVGQEPIPLSTAPIVERGELVPGRVVLRSFWVSNADGVAVMPGGLGRIGPDLSSLRISSGSGAVAKDVWVLSGASDTRWVDQDDHLPIVVGLREPAGVAPRIADNLFWIGRYTARAETTSRLLRVLDDLTEDYSARSGTPGAATTEAMVEAALALTHVRVGDGTDLHTQVRTMLADATKQGSVAYSVDRLVDAARSVRDTLSYDVWHVLSRLERTIALTPKQSVQLRPTLLRMIESLLAIGGIVAESMVRDESWGYLDAGMRLERGLMTVDLLRSTLGSPRPPVVEGQVAEAVLEVGESIITHRRLTVAGIGPTWPVHSAVALLIMDRGNPRSVAFQVDRLADDFELVGDRDLADRARAMAGQIAEFDIVAACVGDRRGLTDGLQSFSASLRAIAADLETRRFARKPAQHTLQTTWSGGRFR